MPLLDTLETWFIPKPQQRPLSQSAEKFVSSFKWLTNWLGPPLPDRDLKPTNFYSFSLYLRCAWGIVARLILSYCIFWGVGLVLIVFNIWHTYPILFHTGRMQAHVWHRLWKAIGPGLVGRFILIPLAPPFWTVFAFILYLPRAFFWNRRARRLLAAGEIAPSEKLTEIATLDTSIWPPPPRQ